jgi:hypothetical protein
MGNCNAWHMGLRPLFWSGGVRCVAIRCSPPVMDGAVLGSQAHPLHPRGHRAAPTLPICVASFLPPTLTVVGDAIKPRDRRPAPATFAAPPLPSPAALKPMRRLAELKLRGEQIDGGLTLEDKDGRVSWEHL